MRCLALCLTLFPAIAFAQDAGPTDTGTTSMDAGTGCAEDCNDPKFDGNADCVDVGGEMKCAVSVGASCIFNEFGSFRTHPCQGSNPGCLEEARGSACTENVGPCTANQLFTCVGDNLIVACEAGQPWLLDCPGFGGVCDAGRCLVSGPVLCNSDTLICGPGFVCGPLGLCEVDAQPDAGRPDTGPVVISEPDPDDDAGCSAAATHGTAPAFGAAFLVGLLLLLRRRGR